MRSLAARPQGRARGVAEGAVLEHVSTINVDRGRRAAEGTETSRGRQGERSPRMTTTMGWSPWTMVAQHMEAQSESTDDSGSSGVGSRQNFGSITAQGKENSGVRVKGWRAGT
jgi:hypothetical protein